MLAFPDTMRLMTGRAFPLPVLGLVHTWIEIAPHRPVEPTEPLELTVYAQELNRHRRGTEVTMTTEARVAGELVWESRSGYLSRHAPRRPEPDRTRTPSAAEAGASTPSAAEAGANLCSRPRARQVARGPRPPRELPARAEWSLPGDLGRRYGAVSGDRNPIHLYPLTARLFGFPRAIAHGMWTAARCLAETRDPAAVRTVRIDFRAPVLLPAIVTYAADAAGDAFALRGPGDRVHLVGAVIRKG